MFYIVHLEQYHLRLLDPLFKVLPGTKQVILVVVTVTSKWNMLPHFIFLKLGHYHHFTIGKINKAYRQTVCPASRGVHEVVVGRELKSLQSRVSAQSLSLWKSALSSLSILYE